MLRVIASKYSALRMKCQIPGREKDVEGSLDTWRKQGGLSGLLMGDVASWNFAEDQLTKDASVIQELVRTGAA